MNHIEIIKIIDNNKINTNFNKKGFTKIIDLIIDMLFEKSVLFFSINLNFPEFWNDDLFEISNNETLKKEEKKKLQLEKAWKTIPILIEQLKKEFQTIELAEFFYLVVEIHNKNKNQDSYSSGFPYFHILFSMRSLIGYNEGILINLKRIFYKYSLDCHITYLDKKVEIYKFWNYIIKNTKYDKKLFNIHFFFIFNYETTTYATFFDFIDFADQDLPYGACSIVEHKHSHLKSMTIKIENEYILIRLWNLFFQLNNIFMYKDKIYQKNYNSKYSYTLIGDITILIEYGNIIMDNLSKHFPLQMQYVNLNNLMVVYFEKAIKSVKNLSYLLPQITINQHLIEFTDGIYNTVYDFFISFNNNKHQLLFNDLELTNNFNCGRYYPFTFHNINKPTYWLNKISQQLNHDQKNIIDFCTYFGRLFHSNPLFFDFPKQSTLVLQGPSNTGKTSLVINLEKYKDSIKGDVFDDAVDVQEQERNNKFSIFNGIMQANEMDLEVNSKFKKESHKILVYCNRIYVKKHLKKNLN